MEFCIMGTPGELQTLFDKIDKLVENSGKTAVAMEGLRGDIRVINKDLESKATKDDIINDRELHEMAKHCGPQQGNSGFWSGMSAMQKTAITTLLVTNLMQVVENIFQRI